MNGKQTKKSVNENIDFLAVFSW